MTKLDLRKELKQFYAPSAKAVAVVDVPAFQFAMVDGAIEPGSEPGKSPAFSEALSALYGISYTLKFMSKLRAENPIDYSVMALEALWWVADGDFFNIEKKDNWLWRAMILQPDHITQAMFEEEKAQVRKKRGDTPSLAKLRLETFTEGLALQIMHIGPYADEPATVAKMDAFAAEHGYRKRGTHHEIYLGDPMRSDPAKLKTILRHPIEKIG
ncbi:MAG: GyrI-like domain-containing protein [Anaerolineales bacterium]|nr:GyrI-like domain-containing protein [Anaerolineales bacterium]